MSETPTTGHLPMEAVHEGDPPWETLRWPGQWSKMLFHPRAERPTDPNTSRASSRSATAPTDRARCCSIPIRTGRRRCRRRPAA